MARTVLDASALIAGLLGEPARGQVEAILRQQPAPSISAVNLCEAVDRLVRIGKWSAVAVRQRVNWLIAGGLAIEPVWFPIARLAGGLRAEHYHCTDRPLSVADCVCLATAMRLEADLATTDAHLAGLARTLGVGVVALPNSAGQLASSIALVSEGGAAR